MLNLGTPELILIMLVALLVLGPQKLPEVARQMGRAMAEVRKLTSGFQAEMRDALQEPLRADAVEPTATPEHEVAAPASGDAPVADGDPTAG